MDIRVVLADDHSLFREGFRTLLERQEGFQLLGEATNGDDLIRLVKEMGPDVILTDIKMPVMDGIKATREIKRSYPGIPIIAVTMFDEEETITEMLEAGATGYLFKNAHKSEVFEAIRAVRAGQTYYCRQTSARLLQMIARSKYNPYSTPPDDLFNEKEREVIRFICQEYSNKEIAEKLLLSTRTIEGYRERIQEKMKARNTAGIVIYAVKNNLFKL